MLRCIPRATDNKMTSRGPMLRHRHVDCRHHHCYWYASPGKQTKVRKLRWRHRRWLHGWPDDHVFSWFSPSHDVTWLNVTLGDSGRCCELRRRLRHNGRRRPWFCGNSKIKYAIWCLLEAFGVNREGPVRMPANIGRHTDGPEKWGMIDTAFQWIWISTGPTSGPVSFKICVTYSRAFLWNLELISVGLLYTITFGSKWNVDYLLNELTKRAFIKQNKINFSDHVLTAANNLEDIFRRFNIIRGRKTYFIEEGFSLIQHSLPQ